MCGYPGNGEPRPGLAMGVSSGGIAVVALGRSDGPVSPPGRLGSRPARVARAGVGYGVTTGQGVAPLVVQTIRPWMAGLTGVLAVR